jgi:hypothetical protein
MPSTYDKSCSTLHMIVISETHSPHTNPFPTHKCKRALSLLIDTYLPTAIAPLHDILTLSKHKYSNTRKNDALEQSGTTTTLSILSLSYWTGTWLRNNHSFARGHRYWHREVILDHEDDVGVFLIVKRSLS